MQTVSYSRLYSLGNFENERIEFEDAVQPGERYEDAYERARMVVEQQHVATVARREVVNEKRNQIYELNQKISTAENRAREVVGYWRRAVKRYDELRTLLNRHGVEIGGLDEYYLPPAPQPEPGEFVESDDTVFCPHCGADITGLATLAYSGPEPECEPGILCPKCREFIADE